MAQKLFETFLAELPPEIDHDCIRRDWLALSSHYDIEQRHLPIPVWARRPLEHNGREAWDILQADVSQMDKNRAYCIYIHVPFCARRCRFCDCYAFKLGAGHEDHFTQYVDKLIDEMRLWSQLGTLNERRVSTIHLGGGTPTFLPPKEFHRLINACSEFFATDSQTEWALESTSGQMTDAMFAVMDELGFTRLHMGIQSLEDAVRDCIHRQEPANAVITKISKAIALGWVVSVDMIAGLPNQTLSGLLDDIELLADIGVDGFSLYELQTSFRNRRFAEDYGLQNESRLKKYLMLQAVGQRLKTLTYRKTLFNHYARERDMNLYFSFPERDEDCLALGTIADGVFGDYHYRHPEYAAYCRTIDKDFPALQGGLRRNPLENQLQDLTTALLSGHIPENILHEAVSPALVEQWQRSHLLQYNSDNSTYDLTGNGSWLIGNMMSQRLAQVEL